MTSICLIGVDGVGKTTHSKNIQKFLEREGKKIIYFHTGRFRRSLLIPFLLIYSNLFKKILICDKSYYDYIAVLYPRGFIKYKKLTGFLINFILYFLPEFDIILFLKASFSNVKKRKNEVTFEDYKKRIKIYKLLTKKIPTKIINTERNFSKTSKQIISIIEEVNV